METPLHPSSYPKDVGLSGLLADSPVPVKRWANSSPWPLLFAQERTASTFDEIPVIDFKDAKSPDPAIRRELADQIRDACINVGFFYLNNIDEFVPDSAITGAVNAAKDFFALSEEEKRAIDIHKSPNFKGYTALLGENTNPENRGDLHEGFDIGWEDPLTTDSFGVRETGAMSGTNIWPAPLQTTPFKRRVLDYYYRAVSLGKALFPLFALALDLSEDYFEDKTKENAAIMRLLHYPPQTGVIDDRIQGIGAHTDYECFTILWQDSVRALQVLNTQGKWIDAVPIPGTVVVNIGDQFARWTNDVFKSTVHRAINRSGAERYSIPLFFGTDYNVLLTALPSCISEDYPDKYEPVKAGDYVKSRLEATYAHSKK